jgi:hypothetical protein
MPYADIEDRRAYMRAYKRRNRVALTQRRRELYAQQHPKCVLTEEELRLKAEAARISKQGCDRRYREKDKVKFAKLRRIYSLKSRYGITANEFAVMWEAQRGRCPICGQPFRTEWPSRKYDSACIDHDHETGIIRGLLCRRCNLAIGLCNDDPETLLAASAYVAYTNS